MKTRGTLVQVGLAAAGLVAAYVTWQRPTERPAADVTVLDVPAARVETLRFENGKRWAELRRVDGRVALKLSATRATYPLGAGEDGALPDGGVAAPLVPASPERELFGNETAQRLFERLAPLKASRSLGVLDEAGLEQVGLKGTLQRLLVKAEGRERAYQVSTAVLGLTSPYLRSESDGQVFLLGPGLVSELDSASSRLVDRQLHAFKPGDFDALVVDQQGRKREFQQRLVPAKGPQLFSATGASEPDERATTWHERLWRSPTVELYGRGETPPGGVPEILLRLEYRKGGDPLGFLEVGVGTDGKALARTEHTAGWVGLSASANALLEEGTQVVVPTP